MAKADLHVHSRYSRRTAGSLLSRIKAPESYSEPETIYQIAKERGMDFVTITDHDEIDGSVQLAEKYADAFTGVETTTFFPEDKYRIHVLIYGLTGRQFDDIQVIRNNIYELREYIIEQNLAYSVAHGASSLDGRLDLAHLEKLAALFDVFEVVNGSRNRFVNETWHRYLDCLNEDKLLKLQAKYGISLPGDSSHVKGYTGGSNDHAGLYIGRTYTQVEAANSDEFLMAVRKKMSTGHGRSSDFKDLVMSMYKIVHEFSAGKKTGCEAKPSLGDLIGLIFKEPEISAAGSSGVNISRSNSADYLTGRFAELIEEISGQAHSPMERNLELFYDKLSDIADEIIAGRIDTIRGHVETGKIDRFFPDIIAGFPALFMFVPFISSIKHLNSDRRLLAGLEDSIPATTGRKILWFSDTFNDLNGVSVTLKKLGWRFWADGIDVRFATCLIESELDDDLPPNVMNLETCYHFLLPYYEDYCVKIPSILKALKQIDEYQPDEIFVSTPGPIGILGVFLAKLYSIPLTGIYHTDFTLELCEMMDMNSVIITMEAYIKWFYSVMDKIKIPTRSYMDILEKRGLDRRKMSIFPRHIDANIFTYHPPDSWDGTKLDLPKGLNLLYVGRISKDKNLEFLVDVYREIRGQRNDINLIVTGNGPYRAEMQAELRGDRRVIFTGSMPNEMMPMIYSQAHALVFPSVTDTYGMAVLEAQCCELPAFVSDKGGPQEIIDNGRTGHVLPALNLDIWVKSILEFGNMVRYRPDEYNEIRRRTRARAVGMSGWETVLNNLTHGHLKPGPKSNL